MSTIKQSTIFMLAFLLASTSAYAESRNMYMGVELGFTEQEDMDLKGTDNDVPTRCDQLLSTESGASSGFTPLTAASLSGSCLRGQDFWETETDLDTGSLIGLQIGYILNNNMRVEFEYLYRNLDDGKRDNVSDIGDKEAELQVSNQGIARMSSHSFMANFFYDFELTGSKFTPYLGIGGGFSEVQMDYVAAFARNLDPSNLGTTPAAAAATTTFTEDELDDTVFTWQVMAGVDYPIDDRWTIGLKARYIEFDDVEDGDTWDRLRGHESAIATAEHAASLGIDPTVEYEIDAEDVTAWGIGINLKYEF